METIVGTSLLITDISNIIQHLQLLHSDLFVLIHLKAQVNQSFRHCKFKIAQRLNRPHFQRGPSFLVTWGISVTLSFHSVSTRKSLLSLTCHLEPLFTYLMFSNPSFQTFVGVFYSHWSPCKIVIDVELILYYFQTQIEMIESLWHLRSTDGDWFWIENSFIFQGTMYWITNTNILQIVTNCYWRIRFQCTGLTASSMGNLHVKDRPPVNIVDVG